MTGNVMECKVCGRFIFDDYVDSASVIKRRSGINYMFSFHLECLPPDIEEYTKLPEPAFKAGE